jgi:hypothetical protein
MVAVPEIHKLIVQTHRPKSSSQYPYGRVIEGWWIEKDGYVWMTTESGVRTGEERKLEEGVEPKIIAMLLMKSLDGKRNSDFNRRLDYQPLRY